MIQSILWPGSVLTFSLLVFFGQSISYAQLVYQDVPISQGTIKAVAPGVLTIVDENNITRDFKIQENKDGGVSLAGAQAIIDFPASVKVSGTLQVDELKEDTLIRFQVTMNRLGAVENEISQIEVLDDPSATLQIIPGAEKEGKFFECEVTAEVSGQRNGKLLVSLPKNSFTRKKILAVDITESLQINFSSNDYRRAGPGAKVTKINAVKFNTGDFVVRNIELEIASTASPSVSSADQKLIAKYKKYSDDPTAPRDVRSQHFILHTDISDRQAKILLDKLETMISLVSSYYGKQPGAMIECYVVKDLGRWSLNSGQFNEAAIMKIKERAGVTFSRSLGRQRQSIVYSCDRHEVVQHEAIHAYCSLTFGSTGPTWYSEGMAELGCYWKKIGQLDVDIDPVVIDYLKNAEPKKLLDIVAAGQVTNDSWQAYSWRWALCHMLACNPNYSSRFKALGVGMMTRQPNASFENVYGDLAKEISFEYDQYVEAVDNGYRPDLAAWQWNRKFSRLSAKKQVKFQVEAKRGWQATGVQVEAGQSYDVAAQGTWKLTANGKDISADGDFNDNGRLVGVIMQDYKLSESFPLGKLKSFVAPSDGTLYFRCQDSWKDLANNDGELTVYVRKTPAE